LRPEFAAPEKISLGHDTNEITICIDDGKAADPVLQHQTRGCEDRIADGHGNHFPVMTSRTRMVVRLSL
jgi:hypothetical protein